jgi:predicted RNase H-like nuclease (RuvC/YqgF family)
MIFISKRLMDANSFYTVLITAITVLGSASAWRYYEKRAMRKEKSEDYMKDECRERIAKLEVLLERSSSEKDDLRSKILELTKEVAELRIKVEFLEDKNKELQRKTIPTRSTAPSRGRPRKKD